MSLLGTITPFVQSQYFDNSGNPLNGGLLYYYAAGTLTLQDTYQDSALSVKNTNPVQLDSAGRPTVAIFWSPTSYKVTCTTSTGTQLWTVDPVPSNGLSQSIVGIGGSAFSFGGSDAVPITATSYASGTTADTLIANGAFFTIDSALLVGTFGVSAMVQSLAGVTTTIAVMNLSDGTPDTPIQTTSGTNTTGSLVTSLAIPFAASGTEKTYGVKAKVSGGTGFVWNVALTRLT